MRYFKNKISSLTYLNKQLHKKICDAYMSDVTFELEPSVNFHPLTYRTLHSYKLVWAVLPLVPTKMADAQYSVSGNHWPGGPRDMFNTRSARKFKSCVFEPVRSATSLVTDCTPPQLFSWAVWHSCRMGVRKPRADSGPNRPPASAGQPSGGRAALLSPLYGTRPSV